jgi:hypothetical protein
MSAIDDINLHEWAEFNVPAELLSRPRIVSPLARRVLATSAQPAAATGAAAPVESSTSATWLPRSIAALLSRRPPRPTAA